MQRIRACLLLLTLAPASLALGYSGIAVVTFSWGETANPITWSWRYQNSLTVASNSTLFQSLPGSNQVSYFNSDFASAADCSSEVLAVDGSATAITARKYGCRYQVSGGGLEFILLPSPPTDVGPAGARAVGTLNFTDSTLTGVLTIVGTTDEPTGGSLTSVGNGANGFNVRTEDTSVYGNAWYGVSSGATLTVDLTGTFAAAGWEITGGTVRLSDSLFKCQQGGIGGTAPSFILCNPISTVPGSYSGDGSHLSFGVDADGAGAGITMREVEIWDPTGASIVTTLSGVLANLAVGPNGTLTTTTGEYRSGRGDGDLCASKIRWDGSKITCGTLTAGALQITGTATPVDTEPDPFSFTDATNVALGTLVTSNAVTISGIAASARTTVTGGQYSTGCTGTFTSAPSNIPDGATVCVMHTSSVSPGTNTITTLNVGGITGTFTSTTVPADTTPETFAFADQVDVTAGGLIVSAPVTISGINGAAPVSVTGGEYSLDCGGTFTAAPGSVNPGQTLCVRHTTAVAPLSATNTTLTVGGVSDTFTSTTAATPPDTIPDAFIFADQTVVALATVVTSAPVTITGINTPAPVTVVGGAYSVGCTPTYVSAPGSVSNDETICVRHTSSATNSAQASTVLTVGGVADTFTSTAVAAGQDATPDGFAFVDVTNVVLSSSITSAPVTITGINIPVSVSVTGGAYSVGCTPTYIGTPGSVTNNQTICVRHTSAATNSAQTSTTLAVGGVTDTFTSTTVAATPDTTPDPFAFADQPGVPLSTAITSAPVTVTGIDGPATVAVTGGTYSTGCTATYVSTSGSVSNNETICVRHTSAAGNSTPTTTTLAIGGVTDAFTSTTVAVTGGGGSGGGGGAVQPFMLGVLALLIPWRRRTLLGGSRRAGQGW